MQKLSKAAETFFNELKNVQKNSIVMVPQHLWPILERTDQYIKDHAQEIINELKEKDHIEEAQRGFKLTEEGYNYLWNKYTTKIVCPHCGKEI